MERDSGASEAFLSDAAEASPEVPDPAIARNALRRVFLFPSITCEHPSLRVLTNSQRKMFFDPIRHESRVHSHLFTPFGSGNHPVNAALLTE